MPCVATQTIVIRIYLFYGLDKSLQNVFVFRKLPIQEFHFSRILQDIGLTNEQVKKYCSSNLYNNTNIYFLFGVCTVGI